MIYGLEGWLREIYPQNRHIRPKIRQQLQRLRDLGYLEFIDRGIYRLRNGNAMTRPVQEV